MMKGAFMPILLKSYHFMTKFSICVTLLAWLFTYFSIFLYWMISTYFYSAYCTLDYDWTYDVIAWVGKACLVDFTTHVQKVLAGGNQSATSYPLSSAGATEFQNATNTISSLWDAITIVHIDRNQDLIALALGSWGHNLSSNWLHTLIPNIIMAHISKVLGVKGWHHSRAP